MNFIDRPWIILIPGTILFSVLLVYLFSDRTPATGSSRIISHDPDTGLTALHDDVRNVTCWTVPVYGGRSISCLRDLPKEK